MTTRFALVATLSAFLLPAACGSSDAPNGGESAAAGSPSGVAGAPVGGGSTGSAGRAGGAAGVAGQSGAVGLAGSGGSLAGSGASGSGAAGSEEAGASAAGRGSAGGSAAAGSGGAGGSAGSSQAGSSGSAMGGGMISDPGTAGDGEITVGPTYTKQTELTAKGAPAGKSFNFTMSSTDSKIYTGLDKTLTTPRAFTRRIDVYVPAKYVDGTPAPFLIIHDGPGALGNVRLALDNLTASTDATRRLPAFIAIAVANGGGDSLGSERGLEYDTMSDRFARFVDTEVLPAVLANAQIKAAYPKLSFTTDPEGRGALGCSSGGAAALTMGWFRPESFRRLITYSGTFVDQQDTDAPEEKMYPLGAWEYHSGLSLIANSPVKPLRIVLNANENDNGATADESGHHNWLLANQRTAAALKAKGYHYRYIYGKGAGHCDGKVQDATLADSLVWVWRGYP